MNCFYGSSAENNYAVEKRLEAFPAIIPQKHPTPFKSEQQAGYIKTLMFFDVSTVLFVSMCEQQMSVVALINKIIIFLIIFPNGVKTICTSTFLSKFS